MAGETQNISLMADKVSTELFRWFKWEQVGTSNENFQCLKNAEHGTKSGTHPNDVVFKYHDPYLNKTVFFNTDLKSYAKGSITATSMRSALSSLANSIDCAEGSKEWKERYAYVTGSSEVRGLLFAYNHDGNFDQLFYNVFHNVKESVGIKGKRGINLDNLPLKKDQKIHIIEPRTINYLQSVISDLTRLSHQGTFPQGDNYQFYYPDLSLHKVSGAPENLPATIESLTGPFFIIKHGIVKQYIEKNDAIEETFKNGYIVYYNGEGKGEYEFVYIFDTLSKYQLLDGDEKIRIRLIHPNIFKDVRGIYMRAIETYSREWGFDSHKRSIIEAIEFNIVDFTKPSFSSVEIGWER
ncbi:hypothetical protein [Photorhabdus laumondii]|uniref:GAPS4 PD-(D/E)XK nuclease domain-containing protein n=1 Tax=Photorhabdus laumondii subsp. clarkei TaxID=2029685 RepID=A0A329VCM7_9GAMM|nr:hypothetical protein [Photorhabdus laumondii]RAW82232.1 hypothetical protein CKY01_22235 [Photorhabdus laumondii subsp. clarkei]